MTDEKRLEEMLPCFCYRHIEPLREHHGTCPAYFRLAVAAHIDAQAKEIERLQIKEIWLDGLDETNKQNHIKIANLQAEIADLQAVRESLSRLYEQSKIEREEMKRTYDKTVERLERELAQAKREG